MATTNIQSFAGDVEVSGELTVTGQLNSVTGSDKVKLTATTSNETDYIPVAKSTTGAQALYTDSNLTYNPANNQIAANLSGNVTGNVSGNAAFATNATYATSATHANAANAVKFTDRDATDDTDYIAFVDGHGSGDKALFTDQNLTYNSSSNQITANLSGNVTGNVSGNAAYANSAGFATNATFATSATHSNAANAVKFTARNANNTTDYLAFVDTATAGDKALFTDSNLTDNASTNQIAANLSGNETGNVSGSAGSATNATFATNATHANKANAVKFTARDATDATDYIAFVDTATAGDKALYTDSNLTYNPANNQIAANLSGNVTGNVSGNAAFATNATHANKANAVAFTARNATKNTDYIAFVDTATAGDKALFTDTNLTYNSSTNQITANLSGNVTGNVSGSAGSATNATFATNATHANKANAVKFTARDATDATDYIAFVDTATAGDKALYTDSNLTYNPANNQIAANLSGNVTGNVSGNAAFATNATHANKANAVAFTARNATNDTDYIAFVDTSTAGDKALFTDSNLTYNSSTNTIGANLSGNVTGDLTGNVTGNVSGNIAGSADTVAFTVRNSNTTDYIAFVDTNVADNKALYVDSNLTYNSSTNQIGANLSGNVSGTNVSATTLHYPTQTIQPVLNGGGTVTYNASSYIKWSERVIAIPIESNEMGASGYIDIETPVSGTIKYFSGTSGSTTATCTAAGVPMGPWQALYYVVTPGQSSGTDQTRFRLVNYQNSTWNPDSNWILICVRNGDGQQLKWLPGQTILAPGQSYNSATRGTYGAVFADSATSATRLTTARTIGGVSFNGTANINLPGVNAAGTQNTTGSAAKLTTARTIGGVSFDGSANINLPGVNAAGTQNTTGSAATLTTARNISGVSFDGSANIDLPGVNAAGTQNTTGSAATLTTARTINGVDFNGSGDIIVEPYISNDDTGDTNCPIVFTPNTTAGYKRLYEDSALYFDNTNNRLYSTQMSLGDYLYHTSDTNTYFGFPANDTINFATSNAERMRIDSNGNVGVGTVSPAAQLQLYGAGQTSETTFDQDGSTGGLIALKSSDDSTGSGGGIMFGANQGYFAAIKGTLEDGSDNTRGRLTFFTRTLTGDATMSHAMTIADGGNVGIGTTNPGCPLAVYRVSNGDVTGSTQRTYFYWNLGAGPLVSDTASGSGDICIYSQGWVHSTDGFMATNGTLTASDIRIKKNIVDADDAECLETLRLLKPKKYQYKDEIDRGQEPVWGFIAQEVRETLPYATKLIKDVLPNIYELANVSQSNVITFVNFNTSNLESNATTLIRTRGIDGEDHDVHLAEVIDEHTIRVEEDLSAWIGSLDESGNVVSGNQLFVYGQEVDDFVFLKKESIWTVATSALQEIDRQQQADKLRIAELERQLASVLERLDA